MTNRSFENVAKFKYLGMLLIHQNLVHEEIKSRLNVCYHSVKGLLSSCLLSKTGKIKMYKTLILPVVFLWV
jgi:hypothetical protein